MNQNAPNFQRTGTVLKSRTEVTGVRALFILVVYISSRLKLTYGIYITTNYVNCAITFISYRLANKTLSEKTETGAYYIRHSAQYCEYTAYPVILYDIGY